MSGLHSTVGRYGELMSGLHSTVGRYGGADEWATQYSR